MVRQQSTTVVTPTELASLQHGETESIPHSIPPECGRCNTLWRLLTNRKARQGYAYNQSSLISALLHFLILPSGRCTLRAVQLCIVPQRTPPLQPYGCHWMSIWRGWASCNLTWSLSTTKQLLTLAEASTFRPYHAFCLPRPQYVNPLGP